MPFLVWGSRSIEFVRMSRCIGTPRSSSSCRPSVIFVIIFIVTSGGVCRKESFLVEGAFSEDSESGLLYILSKCRDEENREGN